MRKALGLVAVLLLLVCGASVARTAELEGFEDEPEIVITQRSSAASTKPAIKEPIKQAVASDPSAVKTPTVQITETAQPGDPAPAGIPLSWPPTLPMIQQLLKSSVLEVVGVLLIGLFLFNLLLGTATNDKLGIMWAQTFCSDGQILDRNFAQLKLGAKGPTQVLVRQSRHSFLFYATGRRFCQGMTATIELRRRQDLLSMAWYRFAPRDDYIDIEIVMNDTCMPPMVLAVAAKRHAKALVRSQRDVEKMAKRVEVTKDRIAAWPSDQLMVYAEHPSLFYDLMTDQLLEQLFGKDAFPVIKQYFRYLHFTTEAESEMDGTAIKRPVRAAPKRLLRFSFVMPHPKKMAEQHRLLAAACHCIDIVASYARDGGFGPEHKKRAEVKRKEIEKAIYKEKRAERQETLDERRQKKMQEEADRVMRLTPQQRQKYREKQEKLMMKRQLKTRKM